MSENQQAQKSKSNVLAKFLDDSFCDPQAIDIFKALGTSEMNVDDLLGTGGFDLGGAATMEIYQPQSRTAVATRHEPEHETEETDSVGEEVDREHLIEAIEPPTDVVQGLVDPEVAEVQEVDLGSREDVYEAMLKLQDLIRVRQAAPAQAVAAGTKDE